MAFFGLLLAAVTVTSVVVDVGSISSWLFAIVGTIVGLSLMGLGTARIRRARRSGWIALAVDMTGVRLGASPTGGPRSFAWADVAAIVLFRETNILPDPGSRKDTYTHSIGVRLRAEAPGSPGDYERQLERARTCSRRMRASSTGRPCPSTAGARSSRAIPKPRVTPSGLLCRRAISVDN
jgi:hypothetical protein